MNENRDIVMKSMNKLYYWLLMVNLVAWAPALIFSSFGDTLFCKVPLFIYLGYEFILLALFPFELHKFIKKYKSLKEGNNNE